MKEDSIYDYDWLRSLGLAATHQPNLLNYQPDLESGGRPRFQLYMPTGVMEPEKVITIRPVLGFPTKDKHCTTREEIEKELGMWAEVREYVRKAHAGWEGLFEGVMEKARERRGR